MKRNILVRLPNWLGDMMMSVPFLKALGDLEREAEIDVIIKSSFASVAPYLPNVRRVFSFDKKQNKGPKGLWQYGKEIRQQAHYELFFCLPSSFSSALMGKAAGATKRIGHRKEMRTFLLTDHYSLPQEGHRVNRYLSLLERFYETSLQAQPTHIHLPTLSIQIPLPQHRPLILFNVNASAQSRRIPIPKAQEMMQAMIDQLQASLLLIGSPSEKAYVNAVLDGFHSPYPLQNIAGQTNLPELASLMRQADLLVTADTGTAHFANALNIPLIVFQGAADDDETQPFNQAQTQLLRVPNLACAPCVKNDCKFGVPPCLTRMKTDWLIQAAKKMLKNT